MSAGSFRLVFASGPTPRDPEEARTLGYEERKLGEMLEAESGAFALYVHRASVPECVAIVRTLGRDCVYLPFAERQALLKVSAR